VIAEIGRAAGINVDVIGRKVQFASAHDLRRSFGFRWSRLVMPAVLQELMRHESIGTTMEFYVGQNAEATAEAVWSAVAKHSAKRGISTASAS
jgi:integrase